MAFVSDANTGEGQEVVNDEARMCMSYEILVMVGYACMWPQRSYIQKAKSDDKILKVEILIK